MLGRTDRGTVRLTANIVITQTFTELKAETQC